MRLCNSDGWRATATRAKNTRNEIKYMKNNNRALRRRAESSRPRTEGRREGGRRKKYIKVELMKLVQS